MALLFLATELVNVSFIQSEREGEKKSEIDKQMEKFIASLSPLLLITCHDGGWDTRRES